MYRPIFIAATFSFIIVLPTPFAAAQEIGPANGSLVIVGGSMKDPAIREKFIELAGGPDAPIVVIPTAGGRESYNDITSGVASWRKAGLTDVTLLHTTDPDESNTDVFVESIRRAKGVWFGGGRQWRLADSYLNTKVHDELRALLDRGGVIGGSSAGATIQGSYLARGDSKTNTVMMGDHEEGMAFLKDVAIDQHLLRRNRHFDLLEIVQARPELLGIGIDENTAIVVQSDRFYVMGESLVAIYDAKSHVVGGPGGNGGPFYFLAPGDSFDLNSRQPYRSIKNPKPLERVERE